ncbi:glycoside hydrolase family 125 protein [Rosettibacter firmus]|uniref:glycoside hydrolase family 125 protein n=1 Tax=Rosettibacter firmus TaxID=3111522 RepID=UPI00336BD25D
MNSRPALKERKFISKPIEEKIKEVSDFIADKELAKIFSNCFPNTLDTSVIFTFNDGIPDTYILAGDIDAMWLRDSTAQIWPYLEFVNEDDNLKLLIMGLINRQTKCVLIDPYANAFNYDKKKSMWSNDLTEMKPELHERKWELDSLCYTIRLAYKFWKLTGDTSCFNNEWISATKLIYNTFIEQQRKYGCGSYKFGRVTAWSTDTVPGNGYGNPIKPNGLIVSIFRPSDDATIFPFLIPSNFFAVISLKQLSEMYLKIYNDFEFSEKCISLANEIEKAIYEHAVSSHLNYHKIFAYEVDGFGNKLFMDDANIPSLLSLPYLGCLNKDDEIYQETRKFILSDNNPYFFRGKFAEGIGSPHTLLNNIWHLSIIMRIITTDNEDEIINNIRFLKNTHADTYFMHESFNKDNPYDYTRSWFPWPNSLFGEMILKLYNEKPDILKRIF